MQLQAQRAFTTRRQISEETESVDHRESSEVERFFLFLSIDTCYSNRLKYVWLKILLFVLELGNYKRR